MVLVVPFDTKRYRSKRPVLEAAEPYRVSAAIGRSRSKRPVLETAVPYRVSAAIERSRSETMEAETSSGGLITGYRPENLPKRRGGEKVPLSFPVAPRVGAAAGRRAGQPRMASMAAMTDPRKPSRSSSPTPTIVVPPGEQTASFITPGCCPVSSCSLPVPTIIWLTIR